MAEVSAMRERGEPTVPNYDSDRNARPIPLCGRGAVEELATVKDREG
jgi:hypothetical protein